MQRRAAVEGQPWWVRWFRWRHESRGPCLHLQGEEAERWKDWTPLVCRNDPLMLAFLHAQSHSRPLPVLWEQCPLWSLGFPVAAKQWSHFRKHISSLPDGAWQLPPTASVALRCFQIDPLQTGSKENGKARLSSCFCHYSLSGLMRNTFQNGWEKPQGTEEKGESLLSQAHDVFSPGLLFLLCSPFQRFTGAPFNVK